MQKIKEQLLVLVLILAITSGILFLAALAQKAPAGNASDGASSALTAPEIIYDFGMILMKDGDVSHVFKVTNPTRKDVLVQSVITSCMCTTAFIEDSGGEKGPFGMEGMGYIPPVNELIKAGGSQDIKVVYNPNAHGPAGIGFIDRFITLTDVEGGSLRLEIRATVTP